MGTTNRDETNKMNDASNEVADMNNNHTELIISKAVQIVCSIIQAQGSDFKFQSQNIENLIKSITSSVSNVYNMMHGNVKPAVEIEHSVTPEYIICLEDGAKVKMLRKYIRQRFGMTEQDYINKWGLPQSYPFVARVYSDRRRVLAQQTKLGHMRTNKKATSQEKKQKIA